MRVLVVEDDKKIADFVSKGLSQAGFSVDLAGDGETGLERALAGGYAAAVIDLMLPGLDGLVLIERLRKRGVKVPVLILSHKLGDFTCHWNASLGLDQTATLPLGERGLIGEHPLVDGVRAVGELAGEAVNTLTPENSGLLGLIWSSGWRDADFDLGVRRGLSAAAPLWSVVAGVSIPFAADGSPDSNPRRPND
jgi:CheY-like chemotaxis protein